MTTKSIKKIIQQILNWIKAPTISWSTEPNNSRIFKVVDADYETISFGYGATSTNHGIWSSRLNAWMTHSDGSNVYVLDKVGNKSIDMSSHTVSATVTRSAGGTVASAYLRTWGRVAQFNITIRTSASTASGGNLFTGTLTNTPLPQMYTTAGTYYGAFPIMMSINTSGYIYIRNASPNAFPATGTSNSVTCSVIYVW